MQNLQVSELLLMHIILLHHILKALVRNWL